MLVVQEQAEAGYNSHILPDYSLLRSTVDPTSRLVYDKTLR